MQHTQKHDNTTQHIMPTACRMTKPLWVLPLSQPESTGYFEKDLMGRKPYAIKDKG